MDMYCDTCDVVLCAKCCLLAAHKLHDCRDLAMTEQEFHNKLTKGAAADINKLGRHIQELQASQCEIQTGTYQAFLMVDRAADEMIALVNKRRQSLKEELRDAEEKALVEVKAACKDTERNKATTQSLLSYMQALQVSDNTTDEIVHRPDPQEQLHNRRQWSLHAVT